MKDKDQLTRKMMGEEYGKSLTGCLTAAAVIALAVFAIGVVAILLSL